MFLAFRVNKLISLLPVHLWSSRYKRKIRVEAFGELIYSLTFDSISLCGAPTIYIGTRSATVDVSRFMALTRGDTWAVKGIVSRRFFHTGRSKKALRQQAHEKESGLRALLTYLCIYLFIYF